MGGFELREPELGESLPRSRRPHLIPPEELALGEPEVPAPRARPRPEDTLRAHEGDVEEHGGEHHGPHVHLEGGIEAGRDGVEGRVGAGVEIPIGDNAGVEIEAGLEGLGGEHVTGDVGGEVRIGPEDGVHGTVGVEGEHLGSEHPVVMGSAGVGFGETGSLTLSGGAELGEHPSGRLDLGGRLRVAPGLNLTGHGGVEGLGGEHVSGNVGGGVELDLNDRLSIMGGVEAGGLGTSETDVRGTAGVRLRF
jgi:hypothetical protein